MVEPPKESVPESKTLEIGNFTSNLQDADSIRLADQFADRLYRAVQEDRRTHPGASIFQQVVRGNDAAGKALCTIQSTFTNKTTGREVLKTNCDGEPSMSFFGGSAHDAVDAVVTADIEYLRDYFAKSTAK